MRIHREGHNTIFIFVITLFLIGFGLQWISSIASYIFLAIALILVFFILHFFRDPERKVILKDEQKVFSPADGEIVVIEECFEEEFLISKCIQVSIFMSPLNVHVNRYPISGSVVYQKYHKGKYLVAWHPKSSTENERTSIAVKNKHATVFFRQIAGTLARRIVCYAEEGMEAVQGEEMGFIKFGSRVDLFLPLDSTIKVKLKQKVKAAEDVIAEFA